MGLDATASNAFKLQNSRTMCSMFLVLDYFIKSMTQTVLNSFVKRLEASEQCLRSNFQFNANVSRSGITMHLQFFARIMKSGISLCNDIREMSSLRKHFKVYD